MFTAVIRDSTGPFGHLTVNLGGIIRSLGDLVDGWYWTVGAVQKYDNQFDVVGPAADRFEKLRKSGDRISTSAIAAMCKRPHQLIWAQIDGFKTLHADKETVQISAIDSTFFEVIAADESFVLRLQSYYHDVELSVA